MELFLGAMLLVGCIGFVLGVLVGTCGTLVLTAQGGAVKDQVGPELDHPEVKDDGRPGEEELDLKEVVPDLKEIPHGSNKVELVLSEGEKEPPVTQVFILKGYVAIQDGWGSHSGKCKRFRKVGTYDQRRACAECCSAQGRVLSALNFDVVYVCHQPSEVYHRTRGCGKLKCARHITTIQMCQCSECRSQVLGIGS